MPLSDDEILRQSLMNPEIFGLLVERHEKRIYGLLYRLNGSRDLDECFQQVWVKAFEGRTEFRHESRFSTWLCGIALNVSRRRRRDWAKAGLHQEFNASIHGPSWLPRFFTNGEERALKETLERGLKSLDPVSRELVVLKYFGGLELPEIARELKKRENTLRVRLHRALKFMRQKLEKEG